MGKPYDLIIIGGGPAGLTTGIYAGRARLECLLLERQALGGQALTTAWVENYPGFPEGIGGFDLVSRMADQASRFGLEIQIAEVTSLSPSGDRWEMVTSEGSLSCRSAILAMGADYARLGVPGEDRLRGKGVSYCATCDGAFFRDVPVAVVGGGDTAIEEALFLTRFASQVTIIHRRDRLRAVKILQERALESDKIVFQWNSQVREILGDEEVAGVVAVERETQNAAEIPLRGVFVCIGSRPNTEFLRGSAFLDRSGFVITDEELRTGAPGLFAAGDCRSKSLRQIATAVGEGALAAQSALTYIEGLARSAAGGKPTHEAERTALGG